MANCLAGRIREGREGYLYTWCSIASYDMPRSLEQSTDPLCHFSRYGGKTSIFILCDSTGNVHSFRSLYVTSLCSRTMICEDMNAVRVP